MVAEHLSAVHGNVHKLVEAIPEGILAGVVKFLYWLFVGSVISLVTGKAIKSYMQKRRNRK